MRAGPTVSGKRDNVAKRNNYDDKFRASAVVMLQAAGYPNEKGALTRIANHLHIPARTLSRWFNGEQNPPPDQTVNEKKGELTDWMRSEIYAALKEMSAARQEASYRDLGTVVGILTDKMQLLSGEPTSRDEHIARTPDERARRVAEIYDRARTRRDRPADSGDLVQ